MEYETPLRICIMLIESIGTGAAVYWIVRPYIHQYEKGKKFMAAFLILEFVHRIFRAWCYLRVPEQVWTAEYLFYYIGMLAAFILFLRGNPVKHLINVWGPAFLFDLYGTVFMVGGLLLLEGGNFKKVTYVMDFGNKKSLILFLVSCITGAYFIGILVEAMERTKAKWISAAKIILACTGAYTKSKANIEIAFFGVPAFIVMLLLNAYYQSRSYKKAREDYEVLESQGRKYDDKMAELYSIKRDTLKYLDKSQGAGDLEYKKEVMEKFDEVLENEK